MEEFLQDNFADLPGKHVTISVTLLACAEATRLCRGRKGDEPDVGCHGHRVDVASPKQACCQGTQQGQLQVARPPEYEATHLHACLEVVSSSLHKSLPEAGTQA